MNSPILVVHLETPCIIDSNQLLSSCHLRTVLRVSIAIAVIIANYDAAGIRHLIQ